MKIRNRIPIEAYFRYQLLLNDFLTGISGLTQKESQFESVILGGYCLRCTQATGKLILKSKLT